MNEVNGLTGAHGSLAEVGSVFHKQNTSTLHVPSNSAPSFRYTRFKNTPEYRSSSSDFVSVPKDLNSKVLTQQAKEFNAFQSDYWKLRSQNWSN
jgi:filamentous hemagglutinin